MMSSTIYHICKLIKEFSQPEKMWLYGSHVKGTANKYSDIDLFLLNPNKNTEQIKRQFKGFRLDITIMDNEKLEIALNRKDHYIHDAIKGVEL